MRRFPGNACGVLLVSFFLLAPLAMAVPAADEPEPSAGIERFYSISFDDPQWKTFETTGDMRDAVALDEGRFDDVPTEEVLRAVLEYPLIGDIFAFGTTGLGIERVSEHCTALRVFLERDDACDVLSRAISNTEQAASSVQAPAIAKMGIPFILRELHAYLESAEGGGGMPGRALS
ncbi:hypothetical protein EII22_01220 [Coriobacteriales bacterium OH1046]|nr:hypothetical protein EII22_01220 [Coriobacteriales bacterium OH1046]